MAQHFNARKVDDKTVKRILNTIQATRYFDSSFRYEPVDNTYNETPTDRVYVCKRKLPGSVVAGGWGHFEIHTEPRNDGGREASNIYLVA